MSAPIYKPVVHIDELGEQGRLPPGGIINAGGTEGPNFTVGGKPVIFADGSASDGSGQVIVVGSTVSGYEWTQTVAATVWHIPHGKNTRRLQVSIWDLSDEMVFSDIVKIVDSNTVTISFNTPVSGRAILMLF